MQRFEPHDGHEGFFIAKFELLEVVAVEGDAVQQVRVEGASVDKGVAADGSDAESAAVRRASGRSRKVKRQHTRLHTRPVEAPPERESDHVLLATLPLVWLLAGALVVVGVAAAFRSLRGSRSS